MEDNTGYEMMARDDEPVRDETNQNKKQTGIFTLLYLRTVLFIVVLIVILTLKVIGVGAYSYVVDYIQPKLDEKTSVDTVLNLKAGSENGKSKSDKSTSSATEKKSDSSSNSSKASSKKSSDDSSKQTQSSSDSTLTADKNDEVEDSANAKYEFDFGLIRKMSTQSKSVTAMSMPISTDKVTSPFGYRINPVTGRPGIHGGIDLKSSVGNKVHAALSGTVLKAKYSSDYGYFVMIDHGNGLITLYGHCSELMVKAGDKVKQGQVVSLSGNTGRSTGPHLHFEVRINNVRVDPRYYLSGLNEA